MMNDYPIMTKGSQDVVNGKKDLSTLVNEDVFQLSKFEDIISHAPSKSKGDLISWMRDGIFQFIRFEDHIGQVTDKSTEDQTILIEDGASQLGKGFKKLKDNVREIVADAIATVKKDIGYGSGIDNSKAQKVTDRVLGRIRKKAFRYPWVAISTALAVGFLLGSLIKPTRKVLKFLK